MNTERLVKIQICVAVIAILVTAFSFCQLLSQTKKLDNVKAEIASLGAKRDELLLNNNALSHCPKPIDKPAGNVEAWLYVGRAASNGQWAPLSEGVVPTPNASATSGFSAVVIKKDSRLVDNIEGNNVLPASDAQSIAPVRLVKAGTELQVLDTKTQSSVGGGLLVWVKVNIPSNQLLEIASK